MIALSVLEARRMLLLGRPVVHGPRRDNDLFWCVGWIEQAAFPGFATRIEALVERALQADAAGDAALWRELDCRAAGWMVSAGQPELTKTGLVPTPSEELTGVAVGLCRLAMILFRKPHDGVVVPQRIDETMRVIAWHVAHVGAGEYGGLRE